VAKWPGEEGEVPISKYQPPTKFKIPSSEFYQPISRITPIPRSGVRMLGSPHVQASEAIRRLVLFAWCFCALALNLRI
jgi:hypothetical protein